MPFSAFHPRSSLFVVALVLAGAAPACAGTDVPVKRSFVIPASDGYGVGDCLSKGGDCGHIVADSWCEANGLGKAISFGPSEDMTSAIASPAAKTLEATPGSFVINCGD